MSGYQGLGRITDPATQAVCKALFDLTAQLQRRIETLERTALLQGSAYQAKGQRLTDLSAPVVGSDAVTLDYLRSFVGAQLALALDGATGTIDTTAAQTVTVVRGLITEIT